MKLQQPQRRLYSLSAVLTLLFLTLPTANNLQYDGSVEAGHRQRGGGGMVSATPALTKEKSSINKDPYSILNRVAAAYSGQSTPHVSGATKPKQKPAPEPKSTRVQKKRSSSEAEAQEALRQKNLFSAYETIVNSESQMPMFLHQRQQTARQHTQPPAKSAATAVAAAKANDSEKQKKQSDQKAASQGKKVKGNNKKKGNVSVTDKASWDRQQRKLETNGKPIVAVKEALTLKTLFDSISGGSNIEIDEVKAAEAELKEEFKHMKDPSSPVSLGERIVEDLPQFMNVESVTDAKAALEALAAAAKEAYHRPQAESGAVHQAIEHLADAVAAAAAAAGSVVSTLSEKAPEGLAASPFSRSEGSKDMNESATAAEKKGTIVVNDQKYEPHHSEMEDLETEDQEEDRVHYPHRAPQESDNLLAYYMQRVDPMKTLWKRVLTTSAIVFSAFLGFLLIISYKMYTRNLRHEAQLRYGSDSNGTVASSPLAFFHYITLGIFAWPAALANSIQLPISSSLSRSGSGISSAAASATTKVRRRSSLGLLVGGSAEKSLLPEPVVAKSSSSATTNGGGGPIMSEVRRTSASHHLQHLQQAQEQFQNQNQGHSSY